MKSSKRSEEKVIEETLDRRDTRSKKKYKENWEKNEHRKGLDIIHD